MVVESKRIHVTLPIELIEQLDEYVAPRERSALIADLLADFVEQQMDEDDRAARAEARREQTQLILERIKLSGRRAADMFLP